MAVPEALMKTLQGFKDNKGLTGILARGKNMYPGGNAAQSGGGIQFGRPPGTGKNQGLIAAAKRRMQRKI